MPRTNLINTELRDVLREAWDAAERQETGDTCGSVEIDFDRFLIELEQRLRVADLRGDDWRGAKA